MGVTRFERRSGMIHLHCQYAQEICKTATPEFKECRPEHFSACHFSDMLTLQGELDNLVHECCIRAAFR